MDCFRLTLFVVLLSLCHFLSAERRVTSVRTLLTNNVEEASPSASPEDESRSCDKFTKGIRLALQFCSQKEVADNCQWNRFTRYINSEFRIKEYQDSKTCCCACQRVRNCSALQRVYFTGECIFHCMGSPRPVFDYRSKGWIKVPFVE